jgi:hypothetical protein
MTGLRRGARPDRKRRKAMFAPPRSGEDCRSLAGGSVINSTLQGHESYAVPGEAPIG